ncbi:hypothetical protein [Frigoribacterium sp. VKM Ac-2530]|uniref:hypothetical protein n=1 Tax=Frigoribacterium sp. VKM Ac-2530 TaxID=2783822 RepID=UPI00188D8374|nr:hypothetical protein [Frigoribacterium sp. VKM Ac-2530]MBF4578956.1 hypothetical protein [Frigoribacterium sp. VKM Ac-2530]
MAEAVQQHTRTPGPPDRYGKPTHSENTRKVDGVGVAPDTGDENAATSDDTNSRRLTLYMPANSTVTDTDEFTVRGVRYSVIGDPNDWRSFYTNHRPGIVVKLERTEYVDG